MVSLWNDMRLSAGKPPMGFVNPFLYAASKTKPSAFNDIVSGDNACGIFGYSCCNLKYSATTGWDAVTGLGSPNFSQLTPLALSWAGSPTASAPVATVPTAATPVSSPTKLPLSPTKSPSYSPTKLPSYSPTKSPTFPTKSPIQPSIIPFSKQTQTPIRNPTKIPIRISSSIPTTKTLTSCDNIYCKQISCSYPGFCANCLGFNENGACTYSSPLSISSYCSGSCILK